MAKCEGLGSGLYPTAALFNHSCHPNIMRVNVGRRMVSFTAFYCNRGYSQIRALVWSQSGEVACTVLMSLRNNKRKKSFSGERSLSRYSAWSRSDRLLWPSLVFRAKGEEKPDPDQVNT